MHDQQTKIKEAYKSTKNIYDNILMAKGLWFRIYNKIVWGMKDEDYVGRLLSFIPDDFNGKMLDVPVGTAVFTCKKYLQMKDAQIIALDYSSEMLVEAQKSFAKERIKNICCMQGDEVAFPGKPDPGVNRGGFWQYLSSYQGKNRVDLRNSRENLKKGDTVMRKEEAVWNRFSVIYDLFIKKDRAAYGEIIERTARLLKPEERVLEIACGTGNISLGLADRIQNMEAIDFSPDMIAIARKKADQLGAKVRFSVQDAGKLQYVSDSFDAVILANTLHIMPAPEKALAEIKRVLKPDGRLIAPTYIHAGNTKAAIFSRLMSLSGFRAYHKWTWQSYHAFLEANGFEIIDSMLIKASFPLAYVVVKTK